MGDRRQYIMLYYREKPFSSERVKTDLHDC